MQIFARDHAIPVGGSDGIELALVFNRKAGVGAVKFHWCPARILASPASAIQFALSGNSRNRAQKEKRAARSLMQRAIRSHSLTISPAKDAAHGKCCRHSTRPVPERPAPC